jgi:glycosidase
MMRSLSELDLTGLIGSRKFTPSPTAWEDEVLYFLLVDRFSDGNEAGYRDLSGAVVTGGTTPLFQPGDALNAVQTPADAERWRNAGGGYVGGTLPGVTSKLGYLKRMGVTAIWLSPLFKQVAFQATYHGYGIQDYLQVNPRFGTADDLRRLVDTAHANGMRVILDIILNHTGNVFSYHPNRYLTTRPDGSQFLDPRWDGNLYDVAGFNSAAGAAAILFTKTDPAQPAKFPGPDDAIWPVEFQDPAAFTCKGHIVNFDYDPEFREGDFFDLKDVHQGQGPVDAYQPSAALLNQCEVYKYWLAFADLDGYRVDTVKHMDLGAARLFGSVIHEFAQRIGKDNFYLIAEITGGRSFAFDTLDITGLDAALGIDDIPDKMEFLAKGSRNPEAYFDLFRNSALVGQGSHTWFRNKVVTLFNDHDQVSKGPNQGPVLCRSGRYPARVQRPRPERDDARHSLSVLRHRASIRRSRQRRRR